MKLYVPFNLNDKSKHNMKQCHCSQPLCTSTILLQQIRSLIMIIQQLNPLYSLHICTIYSHTKHIPINTRKQYPETFFEFKNLKVCPLNVTMKNYGTHFKHHVIFANDLMKKQESLPSGEWKRGRSRLSISTLLQTSMKGYLHWDGGRG